MSISTRPCPRQSSRHRDHLHANGCKQHRVQHERQCGLEPAIKYTIMRPQSNTSPVRNDVTLSLLVRQTYTCTILRNSNMRRDPLGLLA